MGVALGELCRRLAVSMRDSESGTPTNAVHGWAPDSFGCTRLARRGDDYYADWYGRFYRGTHQDTSFDVTSSEQDGGKIVFIPALSSNVNATDRFYLSMEYEPEELIEAINAAIDMVAEEALEDLIDESIIVAASTYQYNLPPSFAHVERIIQESATAGQYSAAEDEIPNRLFEILPTSAPQLWFDDDHVSLTAGRRLRLIGQKAPSRLTLDADITEVPPPWLLQQAKALLHQWHSRGPGADSEDHLAEMRLAQAMADGQRDRVIVAARGWPVGA